MSYHNDVFGRDDDLANATRTGGATYDNSEMISSKFMKRRFRDKNIDIMKLFDL